MYNLHGMKTVTLLVTASSEEDLVTCIIWIFQATDRLSASSAVGDSSKDGSWSVDDIDLVSLKLQKLDKENWDQSVSTILSF